MKDAGELGHGEPGVMAEPQTIRRIVVHGRVQRVFYRAWTARTALERGLDGWVRNRADGTVETLISGGTKEVEAFVAAMMRGPQGSKVANVELHRAEPPEEKGFHRRSSM
jgi:acylphosphatase